MKTLKRVIAVVVLVVIAALVGYLIFTGSQLSAISDSEVLNAAI